MKTQAKTSTLLLPLALLLACGGDPVTSGPVGSAGGTISGDGAMVVIPSGVLSSDTNIAIAEYHAALPELQPSLIMVGPPIEFTPHGIHFDTPVRLVLPHDGSGTAVMRLENESDIYWEDLRPSRVTDSTIELEVDQFSILVAVRYRVPSEMDGGMGMDGGMDMDGGMPLDSNVLYHLAVARRDR